MVAQRIVIVGAPRSGKTTLAATFALPVIHTDALASEGDFSAQSQKAAELLELPGPWVLEGVTMVRALRKWFRLHPEGVPCDAIYGCWAPLEPLSAGQRALARGCATVWAQVEEELDARGFPVMARFNIR